jgi:uncharacterized secreted protein with C-terminal beta-propeller domain
MNPGDRPRNPVLLKIVGGVVAVAAVAALVVVADTDTAAAGELERFASCEALAAWGDGAAAVEDVAGGGTGTDGADVDADQDAGMAAEAPTSEGLTATAGAPDASRGSALAETDDAKAADGTNVAVEGVDELDVVDHLDEHHVLVAAASRLSIVDLDEHRVVANVPVASTVEATYDAERGVAWVVGPDDESGRLTITRVAVTPTSLAIDATWSTDGWLVDARRVEDRLYVVAADGYGGDVVPFASRPVPCDQVLHPIDESDPTATLLVALPATGALEPEHAAEVVGSGEHVHVTTDAAYLATPLYGDRVQTSFHRFDLGDLRLTGSGRVDGSILSQFSMSDFEGHLRVAVTDQGGRLGGIEGDDVAIDIAPERPAPDRGPLNEVVVLDTDGDLDVVGRTPRFGHSGETIQGVRFVGEVAYAVTFLQTDPFYVLDLADPASPKVAGEVQLPGFSSYLHPVADGLVAGFGPDEEGRIAVKLFDVSDRSQPKVVDTYALGDESPIAWDHHAFVDLGDGRFAVPASTYRELHPVGCTAERQAQLRTEEARINGEVSALYDDGKELEPADQARARALEAQAGELYEDGCLYPMTVPESSVVVLDASGGRLELVQRLGAVRSPMSATRVVQTDDGWALLAGNHWIVLDGSGDQTADLELGPEPAGGPYPIDIDGGPGGGVGGSTGRVIE